MNGRTFRFYKFRTMYVDADARLVAFLNQHAEREAEWRHFYKLDNDPRIIPWIGTFLRKSSLDELPNLFNVLKGDMSLVGPRPFPALPYSDIRSCLSHAAKQRVAWYNRAVAGRARRH